MRNMILVAMALIFLAKCSGPSGDINTTPPPVQTEYSPGPLKNYRTGLIKDSKGRYGKPYWRPVRMYKMMRDGNIPPQYDSREHGGQVPIYDQGQCGSCWAFGTTTTMMVNYQMASGETAPLLSPQAIVSCDRENYGCSGGNFAGTYCQKWGLPTLKDYPYTASDSRCNSTAQGKVSVKPKSFVYIGSPDRSPTEEEMQAAIYTVGAVAVSAGADNGWENLDGNGVIKHCNGTQVNHEITAVAYDSTKHLFTIQNSWGQNFGKSGYMGIPWQCDHFSEDGGYFVFDTAPIQPISVHLPAEYVINAGDDLIMSVKAFPGVTYQWLEGTKVIGTGPVITVSPTMDTTYNLIAKNQHGEVEIKTLVTIKK